MRWTLGSDSPGSPTRVRRLAGVARPQDRRRERLDGPRRGRRARSGVRADRQRRARLLRRLRLGDNRYANSIVALRASTGHVVWSFQTVHHDFWDYDNASPPVLADVPGPAPGAGRRPGEQEWHALRARSRDRPSGLSGRGAVRCRRADSREEASPTQPFATVIAPLSPHRFTVADVWGFTEADRAACRAAVAPLRNEGIFTPPTRRARSSCRRPSAARTGVAWPSIHLRDGDRAGQPIAGMVQLIPREGFDFDAGAREGRPPRRRLRIQHDAGTPYVMRRRMLLAPSKLPCTPPPFGTPWPWI